VAQKQGGWEAAVVGGGSTRIAFVEGVEARWIDIGGSAVSVVHRDFAGLVFKFEISKMGRAVGFSVRPLVMRGTSSPILFNRRALTITAYEVADDATLDDAPWLTARALKQFPFGLLRDTAISGWRRHAMHLTPADWAEQVKSAKRPGRRGRPPMFWAQVAADYCSRLGSGREVADMAEERVMSKARVSNLVYEARLRGMLTAAPPGRAGGDLTPAAIALLEGSA